MPTKPKHLFIITISIAIIFSTLALSACGAKDDGDSAVQESLPPTDVPTPTPVPPDRAVLVAGADTDATYLAEAQAMMAELAASSGLEFETRQEATSETITPDVKIIVFLNHPENLGTLAANATGTQFAAISEQNWNPPSNVTIIRINDNNAAFLSGYIASIIAPNYRVGALLASENTEQNLAFKNGMIYYCGLCASSINPLNTYPVISTQSAGSAPETWQAAFDEINASKVNVVYLTKEAVSAQLLSYLSAMDVAVISNQSLLEEGRSRWAGTIYSDSLTPIREIWNDMLSGAGGKIVNASIKISDTQALTVQDGTVWISPGKLIWIDKMIQLLREDQINTQSAS